MVNPPIYADQSRRDTTESGGGNVVEFSVKQLSKQLKSSIEDTGRGTFTLALKKTMHY